MNAALFEQTTFYLTRQTRHWERRLRLMLSMVWVPRGMIAGLLLGIVLAGLSRWRLWLLPEQIALIALGTAGICAIGIVAVIWLWPRSTARAARYFDHRFGLKERVSTALELAGGALPISEELTEHQLSDAMTTARGVNVVEWLPLRVRVGEVVAMVLLAVLLATLLFADNSLVDALFARRELDQAIADQVTELEEAMTQIENNATLTEEEKEALLEPLAEAQELLQQPDISQQEAVATMAEAAQSLQELAAGMSPEQEQAYQDAAGELAGSDVTADLAQALQQPDPGAAADELEDLVEQLDNNELSEAETQELADQLEQAAQQLEARDPELAQEFREAAQALREGDTEAAQNVLREAAQTIREQQAQRENSPVAQAAQAAQQQMTEGQRELAQTGQQPTSSDQQAVSQQNQDDSSVPSQQTQTDEGQSQSPGEEQESQSQNVGNRPGEGQGQPQDEALNAGEEESGEEGLPGDQSPGENTSTANHAAESGASGLTAGTGAGDAGIDTITGTTAEDADGDIPTDNALTNSDLQNYDPVYASSTIGGQSAEVVDVSGENDAVAGESIGEEGDFSPNPAGESMLSYTDVFNDYQGVVSDALESGRIPLDQRDVIHDYFSSLDR